MGPPAAIPVRVLVADDHRLFADALTVMLDTEDSIECVGVAADGREALERTPSSVPTSC